MGESERKTCPRCGLNKPLDEFYKNRNRKIPYSGYCKKCHCKVCSDGAKKKYSEIKAYNRKLFEKYLGGWKEYFKNKYGENPKCEVCGKTLSFDSLTSYGNCNGKRTDICFDHKHRNVEIKTSPSNWFHKRVCSARNIAIWESCNFGLLCIKCNSLLPTDNREEWLELAIKYCHK